MVKYFTVVLAVDEEILRETRLRVSPENKDESIECALESELGWVDASGISVHKITEDPPQMDELETN